MGQGGLVCIIMTFHSQDILTTPDLLGEYYAARGLPEPVMRSIDSDAMPEPYRSLLVHDRDMTTTLEAHWRSPLHVEVLERTIDAATLNRLVVLRTDSGNAPVEFGAIRIHLAAFDEKAREEISDCSRPLGAILREHSKGYSCRPRGFFAIVADAMTDQAFNIGGGADLFGRHNTLFAANDAVLAEVVEILPPMTETR